jgi:tryptophan halogenase
VTDKRIRSIAIVGGGTAGWMAAAGLVRALEGLDVAITLIESGEIATVGVGEATIPPILDFIRQLDLDEDELVRDVKGTFKLGIGYRDWTRPGDFYFHPFGPSGPGMGAVSFPTYWLKMFLAGAAGRLEHYSIQASAALEGRFARPVHEPNTPLNKLAYALHFDALLFARHLKGFAEAQGVRRVEGTVRQVALRPEDGFIRSVSLESGETFEADLFIDCSGFRGVLIEGALKTGYEDWTRWLPCDRALVLAGQHDEPPAPYTLVTARNAGWQWRIPLQHRTGNGYVYSSAFTTDAAAGAVLQASVKTAAPDEPAAIRFTPGRRRKFWNRNCVALGLAAGFMEPLEATSIHLIQRGLAMLLKFFPERAFAQADIDRYNKLLALEFARVRDFLLLHYTQTERQGPFWAACRDIPLTDTLQEKIDLFRSHGRILREEGDVFPVMSWLSVMIGQNVIPGSHDPLVDRLDAETIRLKLDETRGKVRQCVDAMPRHWDFVEKVRLAGAA